MPKFEPPRKSLLDSLPSGESNLYCDFSNLTNEASVEAFFLSRLLKDMGWTDAQIKAKASIESLKIGQGSKKANYKPDYALLAKGKVRCIVEAKGPDEDLHDWIEQCSSYCSLLNRRHKDNPVRHFLLSNGISTELYAWDREAPIVTLKFSDFHQGNKKYERLREMFGPSVMSGLTDAPSTDQIHFIRPTSEKARQLFAVCHKVIWKSEVCSPSAAFQEFMKVMFVKMYEDRGLRYGEGTKQYFSKDDAITVLPKAALRFSVDWIEQREAEGDANPVDSLLFGKLQRDLKKDIRDKHKKRIFDDDERISLRPDTIKDVVRRLEQYDMFGIDEDLNGRLFETFLNATMRGRELGQFFTPRSVVNMVTFLADLKATPQHLDRVIDPCCGSGGFLIEAFTVMRKQVRDTRLGDSDKNKIIDKIARDCIFGIDLGKEPPLARIARANMYLHGDGGSNIYYADGLDKDVKSFAQQDDLDLENNFTQLREVLSTSGFDVILTNPPFAMAKEHKNLSERRILQQYKLARRDDTSKAIRPSLRSSVMYMERYYELLCPGGKLLTVIDDTLLSSTQFKYVREFIRQHFLIRAIISLPGDTFQRSGSRVKCSVLYLEKKKSLADDIQGDCFAYFAEYIGIDDLTPRASEADIQEARAKANREIETITESYKEFMAGKPAPVVLSPERLADRLDLKYCVPLFGRMAKRWREQGIEVRHFSDCVTLTEDMINPGDYPDQQFTLLRVSYAGRCEVDKISPGSRIKAGKMYRVQAGQLLFSTIRSTDGAIGIVPPEMDGALVSGSYSVFDCGSPEETAYLWSVLRSHEIRADMQSLSPGSGRYTTYWPEVGVVLLPWLPKKKREAIGHGILHAWELERQMQKAHEEALSAVRALGVESEESIKRWQASKAPQ